MVYCVPVHFSTRHAGQIIQCALRPSCKPREFTEAAQLLSQAEFNLSSCWQRAALSGIYVIVFLITLEWKAISEQQHHRPFGVTYTVFSGSTLTRFLGAVLPEGSQDSAASKQSCRWWRFWVSPRSAGKANATTLGKATKLREGIVAKPGSLHSAQLYKSQFKLRKWDVSYTVRRRKWGVHFWFSYTRQSCQYCAISICVAVSRDLIVALWVLCSSLGDRSVQECPLPKQNAEKLVFPNID